MGGLPSCPLLAELPSLCPVLHNHTKYLTVPQTHLAALGLQAFAHAFPPHEVPFPTLPSGNLLLVLEVPLQIFP